MKWKIIDMRTNKTYLCNFSSKERAQYRIDNNIDKTLVPFLEIVPQ
jgi:hypothetical protein